MFRRPKRLTPGIDMAPLIDVVFLLLVFFMLTSSFNPPALPLVLPRASVSTEPPKPAPVVSIDSQGVIAVNGVPVAKEALADAIRATLEDGQRGVNFRGDRSVDYGRILELMAIARGAGAVQINLVYDPAP